MIKRTEKDATPGFLADSETWGGGTDDREHKIFARYQINRNTQVAGNCYLSEKPIADGSKTHDYSLYKST